MVISNINIFVLLGLLVAQNINCSVNYSYKYKGKVYTKRQFINVAATRGGNCKGMDIEMIIRNDEKGCEPRYIENKVCAGYCDSVFMPFDPKAFEQGNKTCSSCYLSHKIDYTVYLKCRNKRLKIKIPRILGCHCRKLRCIMKH